MPLVLRLEVFKNHVPESSEERGELVGAVVIANIAGSQHVADYDVTLRDPSWSIRAGERVPKHVRSFGAWRLAARAMRALFDEEG